MVRGRGIVRERVAVKLVTWLRMQVVLCELRGCWCNIYIAAGGANVLDLIFEYLDNRSRSQKVYLVVSY